MRGIAKAAAIVAVLIALPVIALPVQAAEAPEEPQRIVSLNVCSDQLVMLLAEPGRIASLSFLAADPASSARAEEARTHRLNHGQAEEILPLKPDLVLAGAYGARTTVALLRRLGYPVIELPLADGLDDVARHVRIVARALGAEARGERLIAAFEARMAKIPAPPAAGRPVAVLFESNGITSGRGTLPDAVMRRAGFDNLAARLDLGGVGRVPLETVVAARPDAVIMGRLRNEKPSLAARSLHHPALRAAVPDGAILTLPDHLWICPLPAVAEAVERLVEFRRGLKHREPGL